MTPPVVARWIEATPVNPGTAINIAAPSGRQPGDLLIAHLYVWSLTAEASVPGWEMAATGGIFAFQIWTYWRVADGTSADNFSATWDVRQYGHAALMHITGADPERPIDVVGRVNTDWSATPTAEGVTTSVDDTLLIWAAAPDSPVECTPPSGWDAYGEGNGVFAAATIHSGAGATGDVVGGWSEEQDWVAYLIAVAPAGQGSEPEPGPLDRVLFDASVESSLTTPPWGTVWNLSVDNGAIVVTDQRYGDATWGTRFGPRTLVWLEMADDLTSGEVQLWVDAALAVWWEDEWVNLIDLEAEVQVDGVWPGDIGGGLQRGDRLALVVDGNDGQVWLSRAGGGWTPILAGEVPTPTDGYIGLLVGLQARVARFGGGPLGDPSGDTIDGEATMSATGALSAHGTSLVGGDATFASSAAVTANGTTSRGDNPVPANSMPVRVNERPPLRTYVIADTPSGTKHKWSSEEVQASNVHSGASWSDSMPGGFEALDCVLPRHPGVDYADMERGTTLTVKGAGGEILNETRLERAPLSSGDQMNVAPAATGWSNHLDDDNTASVVFIDRRLTAWRGPGAQRRLNLINNNIPHQQDASQAWDTGSNTPGLVLAVRGAWTSPVLPRCEAWYDAGAGNRIAQIRAEWAGWGDAGWVLGVVVGADSTTGAEPSGDVYNAATGVFDFRPSGRYRFAHIYWTYSSSPAGNDGNEYAVRLTNLRVHGDHGLPLATGENNVVGYTTASMVQYIVSRWAPQLRILPNSIVPGGYVVPQAAWTEKTTAGEMLRELCAYDLPDWAVWDDRTFWFYPRGLYGRRWKARVEPTNLKETGKSWERVFNGVVVHFNDISGQSLSVGPVGSGADYETNALLDPDPENPANKMRIRRWGRLDMQVVGTAASATQVGRIFLNQVKLLDTSGSATIHGWIEDENGVVHPYHAVRSGDTIAFVNASDPSPRRIVRTTKNDETKTCEVDLDAPPEGMDALLARLGASLAPLGF